MAEPARAPRSAPRADRVAEWLAAGLCLGAVAWLLPRYSEFFHDDAYITLRYVARWLGGRGLSWNDGEFVEGFSHPAWLLQLAGLGALGAPLAGAARALGVAYLLALFGLWRASRASWLPALLLATQPGLLLWAWGGLETVSFCFWLLAALLLVERADAAGPGSASVAGAAFALATLTRPEAAGVAALVAVWWTWTGRREAALRLVVALALPLAVVACARWLWFGDLLPNSARAKLGGVPLLATWQLGLAYLLANWAAWLPAACVAGLGVALQPRGGGRLEACGAALLLAVVLAGGDHMPGGRFALPAGAVFALAAARRLPGLPVPRRMLAVAGVAAAAGLQLAGGRGLPRELDPAARVGEQVGRVLAKRLPPGALVATATAGSTPYFAPDLRFIDTLGLNDRHIASRSPVPLETAWQSVPGHRKGDGAYVLARAPDVVILGPAEGYLGEPPRLWFLTDFELAGSAEFHARYLPYRFALADGGELVAFLRRDAPAVERLAASGQALGAAAMRAPSIRPPNPVR
ncbi:MAG: hypothetical protein JRH16_03260 [Deltaproteobacteria bacterium]|nr:hypothetical protein [Deltaproteobacteria bacterium]MBW2362997.1 hypothetical protein [Deltaproteobacteria bacterium]